MYGEKQELDDIVGNNHPVSSAYNLTSLSLRDFSILFKALDRDSQEVLVNREWGTSDRPVLAAVAHPTILRLFMSPTFVSEWRSN